MNDHPIVRRYRSSAQAIGDIAILDSFGISSYILNDGFANASIPLNDGVLLCVGEADLKNAAKVLAIADRERYEANVPAGNRGKTLKRYLKIGGRAYLFSFLCGILALRGDLHGVSQAAVVAIFPSCLIAVICAGYDV